MQKTGRKRDRYLKKKNKTDRQSNKHARNATLVIRHKNKDTRVQIRTELDKQIKKQMDVCETEIQTNKQRKQTNQKLFRSREI